MSKQCLAGFSLVEAVLAMAITSAGLIGVLLAYQGLTTKSLLADQTVIAINLARETLEKISAQKDCQASGCGYASTLTSINTSNTYDANPISGFASYVLDSTALEVDPDNDNSTDDFLDASPGSGYARITVIVSFNNGNNSVKLESLIANYPLS